MGPEKPALAPVISCLLAVLAVCGTPRTAADARTFASRPLSLNRFVFSRQAQQDSKGFYYQPPGLCDDYPEESTTPEKIERDFATLRRAGVRIFRFGIGWNGIEEKNNRYNWRFWDRLIDAGHRQGITLIPYVCYTPEWLAGEDDNPHNDPPRDMKQFGDFMFEIVRRYRGKVRAWELWNEPDNDAFWEGDARQYADMVKYAAKRVRDADPRAVVVLGGLATAPPDLDDSFFRELIVTHGIAGYVDVVNVHGYPETWDNDRTEDYFARIEEMTSLLPRGGPDLWLAEFGYSDYRHSKRQVASYGVDAVYDYEHTLDYQAVALIKQHVLALSLSRLSLSAWYRINDLPSVGEVIGDENNRHLGVLRTRGDAKPSLPALRLVARLFDTPVRPLPVQVQAPPKSKARVYAFEKKNGNIVVVGWLRSSRREEVADTSGMARDRRREVVTVALPRSTASPTKIVAYDTSGKPIPTAARWSQRRLSNVILTGRDVFTAELRR